MSNLSLHNHTVALAAHQRSLGTPESRFVADQLERVAQLLKFTGAENPDQYFDRVFASEESVKEDAYDRGYSEGRASVLPHRHCHFN